MDNISVEGNGFTTPIDNFNIRLNLAGATTTFPHLQLELCVYTAVGNGVPTRAALHAGWIHSSADGTSAC